MSVEKTTKSLFPNLDELFAQVERDMQLERKFEQTTPKVVVKTPSLARGKDPTIRVDRLGRLRAFEITNTGPRGGETKHKHFDGGAGGWNWKSVDVRLADEALVTKLDEIDAKIKTLEDERRTYLRERFLELTPLTWDEVVNARKPYAEFKRVYERAKKGETSAEELRVALDKLFGSVTQ